MPLCYFLLLSIAFIALLPAKIIHVDAAGSNSMPNGLSWPTAFPHLQSALAVAQSGDQIWVAQGIYYPDKGSEQTEDDPDSTFVMIEGVEIYGGFPSGGGAGSFEARNYAQFETTLSGALLDQSTPAAPEGIYTRVLVGRNLTSAAVLDGFKVEGGGGSFPGAGILFSSSSPRIQNCVFFGNLSSEFGGAVYSEDSSPIFNNCTFKDNSIRAKRPGSDHTRQGGAVYNLRSNPRFEDCLFYGNGAEEGSAIYNLHSSTTLQGCQISLNSGDFAINNQFSSLTATNSVLSDNDGGIFIYESDLDLTNCTIGRDKIRVDRNKGARFSNCIIWGRGLGALPDTSLDWDFSHCLIEGWDLGGNNMDGTAPQNDPLFANLATRDLHFSNLRLLPSSPCIDSGDNLSSPSSVDFDKNPRIVGTIDLGAFETNFTTFAESFPDLNPSEDSNNNGLSNFADYASGANPTNIHNPRTTPKVRAYRPSSPPFSGTLTQYLASFPQRLNAEDVIVEYQISKTLDPDSWETMEFETDYILSAINSRANGYLLDVQVQLLVSPIEKQQFYIRQVFYPNPSDDN